MCFNVFWQVLIQVHFMLVILHQYYREGSEKKFVTLTLLVVVVKRENSSKFQRKFD
jgi:hypothetical protein